MAPCPEEPGLSHPGVLCRLLVPPEGEMCVMARVAKGLLHFPLDLGHDVMVSTTASAGSQRVRDSGQPGRASMAVATGRGLNGSAALSFP